jgi:outer membrane lipoprotein carrier protein
MKIKNIILLLATYLISTIVYAGTANAKLTTLLTNVHTMQANFSQKIMGKGRVIQQSNGSMALQRPGQFRWEIRQPMPQLIIANGKKMYVYDKDLEQVTVRSLSKTTGGDVPGLLLSDTNLTLGKDFNVQEMKNTTENTQWFLLLPKNKNSIFSVIKINFINQAITEMQLTDHLDQITIIKFNNVKTNITLAKSLFNLSWPRGVDVIDDTK